MRTCRAQCSSKKGLARRLECSVAKPKVGGALPLAGMSLYQYPNKLIHWVGAYGRDGLSTKGTVDTGGQQLSQQEV